MSSDESGDTSDGERVREISKKANKHASNAQKDLLIDLIDAHKDTVLHPFSNTVSNQSITDAWEYITKSCNELAKKEKKGAEKSVAQWRKVFTDLKTKVKVKCRALKSESMATGNLRRKTSPLTPLELKIRSLIPDGVINGIQGVEEGGGFVFADDSQIEPVAEQRGNSSAGNSQSQAQEVTQDVALAEGDAVAASSASNKTPSLNPNFMSNAFSTLYDFNADANTAGEPTLSPIFATKVIPNSQDIQCLTPRKATNNPEVLHALEDLNRTVRESNSLKKVQMKIEERKVRALEKIAEKLQLP